MWQIDTRAWGAQHSCWADAVALAPDGSCCFLSAFGTEDATAALVSTMQQAVLVGHHRAPATHIAPRILSDPTLTWPLDYGMKVTREKVGDLWHVVLRSEVVAGIGEVLWMPHGDWTLALNDWAQQGTLPWTPEWTDWLHAWLDHSGLWRPITVVADPKSPWKELDGACLDRGSRGLLETAVTEAIQRGDIAVADDPEEDEIPPIPDGATLEEYLQTFSTALGRKMEQMITTRWRPGQTPHPILDQLTRAPFVAQVDAIEAASRTLDDLKNVIIVGEMGVGKTLMGTGIPWRHREGQGYRVLVQVPGHAVPKTEREIEMLVPGARVEVLRTMKDVRALAAHRGRPARPEYYVISRDMAKLGYYKEPAIVDHRGWAVCPTCYAVQRKQTGDDWARDMRIDEWRKSWTPQTHCTNPACKMPLWQASQRLRRLSLAEALTRWTQGMWDYYIADEVHELKSGDSAQGQAFGDLVRLARHAILMTGTLNNGYAHDLFYILWRIAPAEMKAEGFTYHDVTEFVTRYGVHEHITRDKVDKKGRTVQRTSHYARPGISPALLGRFLLGRTIFLNLEDLGADLPPYEELAPIVVPMTADQEAAYKELRDRLVAATRKVRGRFGGQNNAILVSALKLFPDHPFDIDPLEIRVDGELKAKVAVPALDREVVYPKEEALIGELTREKAQGRRALVFVEFTGKHDVAARLAALLTRAGLRVAVLQAQKVKPERREAWIAEQVARGLDALIVHPKAVATALDLVDFQSAYHYETIPNLLDLRQASRRIWRIGQTQFAKVGYFAYAGTIQETALQIMGQKLVAAMGLEGKFSEEGLNSLASGDMTAALARAILDGLDRSQSLETLWAEMNEKRAASGVATHTGTATVITVDDDDDTPLVPAGFVLVAPPKVRRGQSAAKQTAAQLGWTF